MAIGSLFFVHLSPETQIRSVAHRPGRFQGYSSNAAAQTLVTLAHGVLTLSLATGEEMLRHVSLRESWTMTPLPAIDQILGDSAATGYWIHQAMNTIRSHWTLPENIWDYCVIQHWHGVASSWISVTHVDLFCPELVKYLLISELASPLQAQGVLLPFQSYKLRLKMLCKSGVKKKLQEYPSNSKARKEI